MVRLIVRSNTTLGIWLLLHRSLRTRKKTCDRVLIDADTKKLTSSQDNYYVAISRARHEAKIYTNDREKLPEAMSRQNVKETALEIRPGPKSYSYPSPLPSLAMEKAAQSKEHSLER